MASDDALDRTGGGKPRFSRKQKRAYAKKMQAIELVEPPKNGLAPFLSDPSLLPKRPPSRKVDKDE